MIKKLLSIALLSVPQLFGFGVAEIDHLTFALEAFSPYTTRLSLGNHAIGELKSCKFIPTNPELIEAVLKVSAHRMKATLLEVKVHTFPNGGITALAFLAESHISIHTWPEYGYVAIDIFYCGQEANLNKAVSTLFNFFQPEKIDFTCLERGY